MSENTGNEDFEKLSNAIADLAAMMRDGFQDLRQTTYIRDVEKHEPLDPRSMFARGPLDRTCQSDGETLTEEESNLLDGPPQTYRWSSPDRPLQLYQHRLREHPARLVALWWSPEPAVITYQRWPADPPIRVDACRPRDQIDRTEDLLDFDARYQTVRYNFNDHGYNTYIDRVEDFERDVFKPKNVGIDMRMLTMSMHQGIMEEEIMAIIMELEDGYSSLQRQFAHRGIHWVDNTSGEFFDYMDIPADKKVKRVVVRFKGLASAWASSDK